MKEDVKKEHMIDEKVVWEWASVEGQEGVVDEYDGGTHPLHSPTTTSGEKLVI